MGLQNKSVEAGASEVGGNFQRVCGNRLSRRLNHGDPVNILAVDIPAKLRWTRGLGKSWNVFSHGWEDGAQKDEGKGQHEKMLSSKNLTNEVEQK